MEQVSINFAKITLDYQEQDPNGKLGDTFSASWDLQKNRAG